VKHKVVARKVIKVEKLNKKLKKYNDTPKNKNKNKKDFKVYLKHDKGFGNRNTISQDSNIVGWVHIKNC